MNKHWPAKSRSKISLADAEASEADDADGEGADEEEGEDEDDKETMTEPEQDDDDDEMEVDPYLAADMGLDLSSPQPPTAYVGTVAYELDDKQGKPVPFSLQSLIDLDLTEQLARVESPDSY